jgi:hypothetical protein
LIHQEEISEQGSVRVQSDECLFLLPALKPIRKNTQTTFLVPEQILTAPVFFILLRAIPVSSDMGYTRKKGKLASSRNTCGFNRGIRPQNGNLQS